MDNPWANAWLPQSDSSSHQEDSQEADIGLPSWSTSVQWNEPSTAGPGNSLWAQSTTDSEVVWEPSTYEGIPVSKSTVLDQPSPPRSPSPKVVPVSNLPPLPDEHPPISLPVPNVTIDDQQSPPSTPKLSHLSPPPSPNAFGSFESADTSASWTSTADNVPTTQLDAGEWGSAWASPPVAEEKAEDEPEDEWEIAKRKKEDQDRHIPPDILATILRDFEELANDLWPEQEQEEEEPWKRNWRSGLDGFEGLEAAISRLIPENLTLPLPTPFNKTAVAKSMADALRATRHSPIVNSSPMSLFLASKGSTAWETTIKSKPDVIQDDSPPGWRMVEKKAEPLSPVNDSGKGKKAGGLLSFFGRKATAPAGENRPPERSSSPAAAGTSTPRNPSPDVALPSTESAKSSTVTNPTKTASPVVTPSLTPTPPAQAPPVPAVAPDLQSEVIREPTPPSAVSRFLNRFSRTKSIQSGPNVMALSSDDLEFLSDIVPSASDNADDTIEPSLFQTKLPPPQKPSPTPQQIGGLFDPLKPSTTVTDQPLVFPPSLTRSGSNASGNRFPQAMMKPSSTAGPSSNPLSSLKLPPPPSSRSHTPIAPPPVNQPSKPIIPSLPPLSQPLPPRPAQVPEPARAPPPRHVFDDDDFSEFHSSPPPAAPAQTLPLFDLSFSSASSSEGLFTGAKNASFDFDDFDDFVSPSLRTPSPPRPPAKPSVVKPKERTAPQNIITNPAVQPARKVVSPKPDHSRTASLVENAAARRGRWPAPASPLPEVLPPPGADRTEVDYFGGSGASKMQAQQANAMKASMSKPTVFDRSNFNGFNTSRSHTPPIPPLLGTTAAPQNPLLKPTSRPMVPMNMNTVTSPPTSGTSSTGGGTGKLSAQDLSFFEGL